VKCLQLSLVLLSGRYVPENPRNQLSLLQFEDVGVDLNRDPFAVFGFDVDVGAVRKLRKDRLAGTDVVFEEFTVRRFFPRRVDDRLTPASAVRCR